LLTGDPPYADLFYNVACCESLAGRNDEAIAHLRRAIELSVRTRSFLEPSQARAGGVGVRQLFAGDPGGVSRDLRLFLLQSAETGRCASLGVWLGCDSRFGREHSSRKPSEAALKGDEQGLFRAQATRESRHGRRPRAVFLFTSSRAVVRFAGYRVCSGFTAAHVAQVPALRDRATGRSGSRR
jgi:hypothetical protein